MAAFILWPDVPILDEYEDDEAGIIDRARLSRIAANTNKYRPYLRVSLEHSYTDRNQWIRPAIGYARNLRVKRLFQTDRAAIHADLLIEPSQRDRAARYQR